VPLLLPGVFLASFPKFSKKNRRFHKNLAVNLHTNTKTMTQRKYNLFVALVLTGSFAIGQGYKPAPKDIGRLVNENKKWGTPAANSSSYYQYSSNNKPLQPVHIDLALPDKSETTYNHEFSGSPSTESSQESFSMVHPNSYYEQLGFFCRKEIQLQKVTTVPVKFRLGSYDYVNWLEGKEHRP